MQNNKGSPIPLTIVGGFLGSGKTSLLNHILTNASGKRIAVLVNDFGEINVDAKLIVSIEGETVSLANGCVCCTIRDDLLVEVLKVLTTEPAPEHIVVETSGVSKPVGVAETFLNPSTQSLIDVRNMITVLDADLVADASMVERTSYGNLAFDQIAVADLVVINKTDLVTRKRLAEVKRKVEAIVPRARVWETTFGEVPLDLIFNDQVSQAINGLEESEHEPSNQHGRMFSTWTYRSDDSWSFNALQRAVEHLPKDIYRAKGIVRLDTDTDDYGVLQVTGRRATLRLCQLECGDADEITTELVFIGKPGSTSNDDIGALFGQSLEAAHNQSHAPHQVADLRAFEVLFV